MISQIKEVIDMIKLMAIVGSLFTFVKGSKFVAGLSAGPITAIINVTLFWGIIACVIGSVKSFHMIKKY